MIGVVHQRAVQGDQVTLSKQLIECDIGSELLDSRILEYIISDDLHAESVADSCHGSADLTGSDDTGGLAVEVHTHQTVQAEVIFTDLYICFVQMTVDSQSQ